MSTGSTSTGPGGRYRKNSMLSPEDYGQRRVSQQRRASAVSAARRLSQSAAEQSASRSSESERRISIVSYDDPATPSTLRRSVSAFGEITVMPVGDNEDEELKIAVEEEVIR